MQKWAALPPHNAVHEGDVASACWVYIHSDADEMGRVPGGASLADELAMLYINSPHENAVVDEMSQPALV